MIKTKIINVTNDLSSVFDVFSVKSYAGKYNFLVWIINNWDPSSLDI